MFIFYSLGLHLPRPSCGGLSTPHPRLRAFRERLPQVYEKLGVSDFSLWVAMQLKTRMQGTEEGRLKCQQMLELRDTRKRLEMQSQILSERLAELLVTQGGGLLHPALIGPF